MERSKLISGESASLVIYTLIMYGSELLNMAAEAAFKQDLPPKGGYAPINFKRVPAKQVG